MAEVGKSHMTLQGHAMTHYSPLSSTDEVDVTAIWWVLWEGIIQLWANIWWSLQRNLDAVGVRVFMWQRRVDAYGCGEHQHYQAIISYHCCSFSHYCLFIFLSKKESPHRHLRLFLFSPLICCKCLSHSYNQVSMFPVPIYSHSYLLGIFMNQYFLNQGKTVAE